MLIMTSWVAKLILGCNLKEKKLSKRSPPVCVFVFVCVSNYVTLWKISFPAGFDSPNAKAAYPETHLSWIYNQFDYKNQYRTEYSRQHVLYCQIKRILMLLQSSQACIITSFTSTFLCGFSKTILEGSFVCIWTPATPPLLGMIIN